MHTSIGNAPLSCSPGRRGSCPEGVAPEPVVQHLDQGDGPLTDRRRLKSLGMSVRSSRSQVVKASGLRWISLMWLGQVPWAGRALSHVLAPSARYHRQRGRHKKLTDWARR